MALSSVFIIFGLKLVRAEVTILTGVATAAVVAEPNLPNCVKILYCSYSTAAGPS